MAATRLGALTAALICATSAAGQEPARRVVDLVLREGRVSGPELDIPVRGAPTLRLRRGEQVELRWTSDRAIELHLHGYGIEARTGTAAPAAMSFLARASGRFPIETHDAAGRHKTLLYLEIHPR
jgi:hypothetical protein